jgi:hypothetical protein
MPAIPPRPIPGHHDANLPHLGKGEGDPRNEPVGDGVHVPQALGGWHDLNMAVARSLPTNLLRAGQIQRGIELSLRRRGKVR